MPDRRQLEQAIVVLDAQRPTLGNDVVELSLASLRHQLGMLEPKVQVAQYENVTVLVADLSGYTAMSELMDAEEVRDTINAIWDKLDGVVQAWGGRIDKHTGDGLIALFGLPNPHADDRERAVMAALDMQMELALLNQGGRDSFIGRPHSHAELHMRIGIDVGPVVFGRVGMDGQDTAMGDAVRLASQLQQLAPTGGTLVSYDIYAQIHASFEVEPLAPVELDGKTSRLGIYVVKGESGSAFDTPKRSVPGSTEVRFVGRHAELEQLQHLLQMTMESGTAQFVTITGESGVGKSKLIDEFEKLLRLSPVRMRPFKGSAHRHATESPFALWRDLFRNHFNIHTPSSTAVAMERLAVGLRNTLVEESNASILSTRRLGRLLGFHQHQSTSAADSNGESPGERDTVYRDTVDLFRSFSTSSPATLIIMDDVQWADEKSLDLLDHLFHNCQDIPLIVLCSGRPEIFEKHPFWRSLETSYGSAHLHLELAPLSSIDSRHLIGELLRDSAQLPLKLIDLIIERTGGNPSYIEELTRMLLDGGVLFKEGNHWRAQFRQMEGGQMLPSLTNLLQARLDQLPPLEQELVNAAAVFGRIFWKTAVTGTLLSRGAAGLDAIEGALTSLEQQELIYRHKMPGLVGVHEYVFRHNRLRNLAYHSIGRAELADYHGHAASWLIANCGSHLDEYASIVANHFEKSEQVKPAAEWYGRAAAFAKSAYSFETAIQQYRRALDLLPGDAASAKQRIDFHEELAGLLRRRARYAETVGAFEAMKAEAQESGSREAEVRALLGLYLTHEFQGDQNASAAASSSAVDLARIIDSPTLLAAAMATGAWSLARAGKVETALAMAREALTISTKASALNGIALSDALIGSICRIQHWYDQANRSLEKALVLFRQLGNREWEALMLENLGRVAFAERDYTAARTLFKDSLGIATNQGELYGMMRCLRRLGGIYRLENKEEPAIRCYQEAFMLAEKSRNSGYCAYLARDIGEYHLERAAGDFHRITDFDREVHLRPAHSWLDKALQFSRNQEIPVTTASVKTAMARLHLLEGEHDEALFFARESVSALAKHAQSHPDLSVHKAAGVAWRTLGIVAEQLSGQQVPVRIAGHVHDAASCYRQSLRSFSEIRRGAEDERAYTLFAWARFALGEEDEDNGALLWQQALALFAKLGMETQLDWMNQVSE